MSDKRRNDPWNNPAPAARQPRRTDSYRRAAQSRSKKGAFEKSSSIRVTDVLHGILFVLKMIGKGIIAVLLAVWTALKALYHLLDPLRKTETAAIFVNSAIVAVFLIIALSIMVIMQPANNTAEMRKAATCGDVALTQQMLRKLERSGIDHDTMEQNRIFAVRTLIECGELEGAASILSEVTDAEAVSIYSQRISYEKAKCMYESGDFNAAAQVFYQMSGYEDCESLYEDCRCAMAIEAYNNSDMSTARMLLSGVPNVKERVLRVANEVLSGEDAEAMLASSIFSADSEDETDDSVAARATIREGLPQGRIAVGYLHTVGIQADGSVRAVGDNSRGQCDVTGWSSIKQIGCGAAHTVGLKSDGTVVATGDNSQKQCDVSGWSDIVMIAAGAFDTIGLKSDGTVVAAGMHADKVTGWHDATMVAAGGYSMACLYDKGSMLSSHTSAQANLSVRFEDVSICGSVSVGVLSNGTVYASGAEIPEWTDIVSVTAHPMGVFAIDSSGNLKSYFYRNESPLSVNLSSPVVEVESSGTHHVILTLDGQIFAIGENGSGQCNVGDWQMR